jgi:hypothetical protein
MLSLVTERGDVMMRVLCTLLLGLVIVCLAGGVAVSTEAEKADSTSSSGLVYGYGVKLTPPYEFTKSQDGKILYLNGMIYDGPSDIPPKKVTVDAEMLARHELSVRAYEQSELGATYEERLTLLAAVYLSSPLVKKVRKHPQGLYVTWVSDPATEQGVILLEENEKMSDYDLAAFRAELITRFWRTVDSGGMMAFGKDYHVLVPQECVPKTVEQIESVWGGTTREELDIKDTALQNQQFLDDLFQQSEALEGE